MVKKKATPSKEDAESFKGEIEVLVKIILPFVAKPSWLPYDDDFERARVQGDKIVKNAKMWDQLYEVQSNFWFTRKTGLAVFTKMTEVKNKIWKMQKPDLDDWISTMQARWRAQGKHIRHTLNSHPETKWLKNFAFANVDGEDLEDGDMQDEGEEEEENEEEEEEDDCDEEDEEEEDEEEDEEEEDEEDEEEEDEEDEEEDEPKNKEDKEKVEEAAKSGSIKAQKAKTGEQKIVSWNFEFENACRSLPDGTDSEFAKKIIMPTKARPKDFVLAQWNDDSTDQVPGMTVKQYQELIKAQVPTKKGTLPVISLPLNTPKTPSL